MCANKGSNLTRYTELQDHCEGSVEYWGQNIYDSHHSVKKLYCSSVFVLLLGFLFICFFFLFNLQKFSESICMHNSPGTFISVVLIDYILWLYPSTKCIVLSPRNTKINKTGFLFSQTLLLYWGGQSLSIACHTAFTKLCKVVCVWERKKERERETHTH